METDFPEEAKWIVIDNAFVEKLLSSCRATNSDSDHLSLYFRFDARGCVYQVTEMDHFSTNREPEIMLNDLFDSGELKEMVLYICPETNVSSFIVDQSLLTTYVVLLTPDRTQKWLPDSGEHRAGVQILVRNLFKVIDLMNADDERGQIPDPIKIVSTSDFCPFQNPNQSDPLNRFVYSIMSDSDFESAVKSHLLLSQCYQLYHGKMKLNFLGKYR